MDSLKASAEPFKHNHGRLTGHRKKSQGKQTGHQYTHEVLVKWHGYGVVAGFFKTSHYHSSVIVVVNIFCVNPCTIVLCHVFGILQSNKLIEWICSCLVWYSNMCCIKIIC